jgi:hypothetical protein
MGLNAKSHARLLPTFSAERWDRSKNLRNGVGLAFLLCSLGAAGNWYNWLRGIGTLSFPVGLTIGAAIALMVTPRKWDLLVMSASGMLGLEILAVVLRKGPLRPLLEAIVGTFAVVVVCEYVRGRLKRSRRPPEARQATGRKE